MAKDFIRSAVDLEGVVQGVGFRPAVYRLATAAGLGGRIRNESGKVRLILEGPEETVERFLGELPAKLPPQAKLRRIIPVARETVPFVAKPVFRIDESRAGGTRHVVIPADLAMCPNCMGEILDPGNRRYGYPFTTCTDCGPRYTVVNRMPYDRENTTMSAFPLCDDCRKEYTDPNDRRFHAESMACPKCGPKLWLLTSTGEKIEGDALRQTRIELARGKIVAVRGIGGFLLAVDASNAEAVRRLRERKHRPHKPLAVMADSLGTIGRYCEIPTAAEELLNSPQSPIVILNRKSKIENRKLEIAFLTPDADTLGVMLPTTPLHRLLFQPLQGDPTPPFEWLVMTSGNRGGEPICLSNEEALGRLGDIADFILCHDREINLRNDDSLFVLQHGAPQVWRRARGLAPEAVRLAGSGQGCVLAMGGEMKNAMAMGYEDEIVLSPHVGDLDTVEAVQGLEKVAAELPKFLDRRPDRVAVDLHPDMHSTVLGRKIAADLGLPVLEVQHHHAHAAACMAEHGLDQCVALVFDGTGLGPDGKIWGAELLQVNPGGFKRLGTFEGVPLPGGDAAVLQPARQLIARWIQAGTAIPDQWRERLAIEGEEWEVIQQQCRSGINTPWTHAAGRVFDSFSVLLGLTPPAITYDGQPAIRLESSAARGLSRNKNLSLDFKSVERNDLLVIEWGDLFVRYMQEPPAQDQAESLALAFHDAMARAAFLMAHYGVMRTGCRAVVLSGGVFMNRILNEQLIPRLEKQGLQVFIHRMTPPNDGCIALGQAAIALKGRLA